MFHAVSTHSLGFLSHQMGPLWGAASEEGWEMSWRGCEAAAQSLPIALVARCLSLKAALHPCPQHAPSVTPSQWSSSCDPALVKLPPLLGHRSSQFVHKIFKSGVLVSPVCQLCCLLFFKVRPCENLFPGAVSLDWGAGHGAWTFCSSEGRPPWPWYPAHFWVTARGLGVRDLKRPQVQVQVFLQEIHFYFSWVNI